MARNLPGVNRAMKILRLRAATSIRASSVVNRPPFAQDVSDIHAYVKEHPEQSGAR
ncbi:MAG: hypothetical protein M1434_01190 [Chloroflexi bacterium]|nr:hypothetical protein [Chloroflexota bacterium]MCL5273346.1 hypothetical protein [Chloroflexota bacterium]